MSSESEEIRIRLEQQGDYAFRIDFEGTDFDALMTDEPEPLGAGSGPNPSRLLLASVANCLSASLLFALRKFKNSPGPIVTEAVARMERNSDGRWRIPRMEVRLKLAEEGHSYEHLDRILGQFEAFCVVTQSVRDGVEVDVSVEDSSGRVLLD